MYLLEEDQEGSMTLNMTWHLDEDWLILGFVFSTKPGILLHCTLYETTDKTSYSNISISIQ